MIIFTEFFKSGEIVLFKHQRNFRHILQMESRGTEITIEGSAIMFCCCIYPVSLLGGCVIHAEIEFCTTSVWIFNANKGDIQVSCCHLNEEMNWGVDIKCVLSYFFFYSDIVAKYCYLTLIPFRISTKRRKWLFMR